MKLRESDPKVMLGFVLLYAAVCVGIGIGLLIAHFWK
jgi:NADH:ubiquinone oxidoreductase subunit K